MRANWEHVGNLRSPRKGHRAIANGDRIYIIGGDGITFGTSYQRLVKIFFLLPSKCFLSTEIWSMDDNQNNINIKVTEPDLYNYAGYPELFLVPSDFCSKTKNF